jgi:hypothetical protein
MSGAGDENPITNVDLTFADSALSPLPVNGVITSGVYQVSVYEQGDYYPAPAPAYNTNALAGFIGTPLQGTWSLWISDFGYPATGTIAGGWALTISFYSTNQIVTNLPPAKGATLSSPGLASNDRFQFTATGSAGVTNIIQASSNLQTWTNLSTNSSSSGSFNFIDTTPISGHRFYRVLSVP